MFIGPSDQSDANVTVWLCIYLSMYLSIYLSIYISMSRRRVQVSFPQCPSHLLCGLLFIKANHGHLRMCKTGSCIPSQLTTSHLHLSAKACSAVLDAFYLLQLRSKVISQTWADLSRSKDDADLNIRKEYRYTS